MELHIFSAPIADQDCYTFVVEVSEVQNFIEKKIAQAEKR